MADDWIKLLHRFKARLESIEKGTQGGSLPWKLYCLERALELLEEDPDAAWKCLDDFDMKASIREAGETSTSGGKRLSIEDIRARFDNLGGGIV